MQKKAACAGILLCFLANSGFATDYQGHLYGEAKGGGSWATMKSLSAKPLSGTDVTVNKKKQESTRFLYGGSIGYQFGSTAVPVRIETEYLRRYKYQYNSNTLFVGRSESLKSDIVSQTVLGNLFIDIPVTDMFMVFIGGGMGVAFNRTHSQFIDGGTTTKSSTDRVAYSWMGSAGMGVQPTDWLAVTLSYRYSDLGDVRWSVDQSGFQMNSGSFRAHEALLGIRLSMPKSWSQTIDNPGSGASSQRSAPNYHSYQESEAARRQQAAGNIYADK